jgi:hypothetical protein
VAHKILLGVLHLKLHTFQGLNPFLHLLSCLCCGFSGVKTTVVFPKCCIAGSVPRRSKGLFPKRLLKNHIIPMYLRSYPRGRSLYEHHRCGAFLCAETVPSITSTRTCQWDLEYCRREQSYQLESRMTSD